MKIALPPVISSSRKILILGTMPGEKSIAAQQYYANRGNQFWRLLFAVFDEPFTFEYQERLQLLQKHNIGLWNILSHCEREGSSDSKIKNELPNDINAFLNSWSGIKYIFFESISASRFYDKYIGRTVAHQFFVLPSTSGLYASRSFDQKLAEWKALRDLPI